MLSFWAGGISSFPPCAREYRLLRRLGEMELTLPVFSDPFPRFSRISLHCEFDFCKYFEGREMRYTTGKMS